MVDMSKSLASFHLSSGGQIPNHHANSSQSEKFLRNKTAMDESVDHLFKEGESVAPQEGSSKGKYFFSIILYCTMFLVILQNTTLSPDLPYPLRI